MTALERVSKARTRLILDQPWFGTLSTRLHLSEASPADCPTAQTDGTSLFVNPEWIEKQADEQIRSVVAHTVLHCALLHPFRLGRRDLAKANKAADYVVNLQLRDAGFKLWQGALLDDRYRGMAFEQVYALLGKDPPESNGNKPNPQPGGVQPPPADGAGDKPDDKQCNGKPKPEALTPQDWQVAAEQAAMIGRKSGDMPGDVDRALKASRDAGEDWRAILRDFVIHTVPADYSWTRPNRRFFGDDLYLPGIRKENAPRFAVAIDTSGSISNELLSLFASELTALLHEVRPESIDVIYCDTRVRHTESFSPDDAEIKLNAKGGGGTRFTPVFTHIAEQEEPPAALIYFTDLECSDIPTEPDYPVLWATSDRTRASGAFGQTVHLTEW